MPTDRTEPPTVAECLKLLRELKALGCEPFGYRLRSPWDRHGHRPPGPPASPLRRSP